MPFLRELARRVNDAMRMVDQMVKTGEGARLPR